MTKSRRGAVLPAWAGALSMMALVAGTRAFAQEGAELAGPDTQFLAEAIRDGMAEVELGKTAAQKAASPEVKRFAERMVADHTAANEKLAAMAEKHKIEPEGTYGTPPLRPAEEGQAKQQDLSTLSGEAFDRAYMAAMVEDHEKAVGAFKQQAEKGQDAELRSLAEATLPTLEDHLRMAQSLAAQVGASR